MNDYRRALQKRLWLFQRDEDGAMIIFSLAIFLVMVLFGGIAVDFMVHENERTRLQNATDRAVLAAANLDQRIDPTTVVLDYMSKVGIDIPSESVTVKEVGSFPVITG
ncbi:MAG: Tad domain-containing protein, partial [Pseudomonadota bacterium]